MDYAKIYEQYADNVYRYIYLMVHKKEIAEVLTQETFIKVLKNLNQFNQTSSLNTWIIKIAKNTTYDYFRKTKWVSFFTDNNNVPDTIIASAEDKVFLICIKPFSTTNHTKFFVASFNARTHGYTA